MNVTSKRAEDGSIELSITIPWDEIKKTYEHVIDAAIANAELPGFRKGKAPRKLIEEKLDSSKTYEEVIRELIPKVYNEAVAQEKIRPIVSPKIEFKEAQEGKDWLLVAYTCEKPPIELKDYKKAISDLNLSKRKKIWTPGQTQNQQKEKDEESAQKPTLEELISALVSTVVVNLPKVLVEQEVNRLLSDLIDQTKRLGLSVEQYLSSTGRTGDGLREEYRQQAVKTLTLEFALEKIADTEGILVSDDDIETVVKTAKSDEERKTLESQRYYLASVLRRQKTLDFLRSL